jgi:hypothetical protein
MSGGASILVTIAACMGATPVAAQAPATTTAFDGTYVGVSRTFLESEAPTHITAARAACRTASRAANDRRRRGAVARPRRRHRRRVRERARRAGRARPIRQPTRRPDRRARCRHRPIHRRLQLPAGLAEAGHVNLCTTGAIMRGHKGLTIFPETHTGGDHAMKRYLLTLVFVAGCAPIVPDKPGATQSELNVDQAQCNSCACAPFYRRTGSARPTPGCPEQCRGADGGDCHSRQSQEGLGPGEAQQGVTP